jgi:hypothetical protein
MKNRYLRFVPFAEHHALARDAVAIATAAVSITELPQADPPLMPRDCAVFLLQLAAEVEHALLAQYLYAAFSLDPSAPGVPSTAFKDILSTAQEEMGHLMTVQNVLLALGEAPSLYREDMPADTSFYPFPLMLEPVSKSSLAKYVLAEMPDGGLSAHKLSQVRADAGCSGSFPVNQVGHLYQAITESLNSHQGGDAIFDASSVEFQGDPADWGAGLPSVTRDHNGDPTQVGPGIFVARIRTRAEAIDALKIIALQGEGAAGACGPDSHFERFLRVYESAVLTPGSISLAIPTHPNTSANPTADEYQGAITNKVTRLWAQLLNSRYRMLLAYIGHYLVTGQGAHGRKQLADSAFAEMSNVGTIAQHIVTLDRTAAPGDGKAGPPFEMPHTLQMPTTSVTRWRMQQDLVNNSHTLKMKIAAIQGDSENVLGRLSDDVARLAMISEFIAAP